MSKLRIVKYLPAMYGKVLAQVSKLRPEYPLRFRGFVDAYYASSGFCQLNLALDEHGEVAALHGVEWMPFQDHGRKLTLGFGSNFHAFRPGAGACLVMSWLRSCDAGFVFGCSREMSDMITRARWRHYTGIHNMLLNRRICADPKDGALKRLAKKFVKHAPFPRALAALPDRLPRSLRGVSAAEVASITDGLLDFRSAFALRFAPDRKYLAWRYGPEVPYARYRTFRIAREGRHLGYAVLLDRPGQLIVAHGDGAEPAALAAGIVHAICALARDARDFREVQLSSAHPAMQQVFESVGFAHKPGWDLPFALGTLRGGFDMAAPVSQWLVNYGWGDNGLRAPFPEQALAGALAQAA